ncbi:hypothetical protein NQ317_016365 [Molorchus minor]|uniref:BHLH domain-containing protein n=1 Tax=Molorchus minor TaxID=1323400 RepID=A0ABQ9JF60_9CUCU|nr:hypothetical protein NQ317_016365 [Molorchus minor]
MSQISVVHYNPPINKVNVLQQNNISNKQNDRQIIVLRKPQHILPQHKEFNKDDVLITNQARKKPKSGKDTKSNPQPVAVARRNARERNRVKQVNIGFATLRQHIPNFIAAAFENNSGRGGSKKLSKVETLRMAVEYIRSLEDVLAMDGDNENTESISDLSYPSPSSSSTSPNHQGGNQTNLTYSYQVLSPPEEDDDVSSIATPPPQQFIRIGTSNSYQIISNSAYEDGENLDPMSMEDQFLADPTLMDPNLEFSNQDFVYLGTSSSPGMYSDASLSPHSLEKHEQFIPVFNTPPEERLSSEFNVEVKTESSDLPVISLKTENELPDEQKESIVDVLQWWEQQPQHVGS